jgi:hypothetical protein
MKVKKLFETIYTITDHGESTTWKNVDKNKNDFSIKRYAVWGNKEVVDTSNDINYLMKKYNIPKERVVKRA